MQGCAIEALPKKQCLQDSKEMRCQHVDLWARSNAAGDERMWGEKRFSKGAK